MAGRSGRGCELHVFTCRTAWRHCCVGQERARKEPVTCARRDGGLRRTRSRAPTTRRWARCGTRCCATAPAAAAALLSACSRWTTASSCCARPPAAGPSPPAVRGHARTPCLCPCRGARRSWHVRSPAASSRPRAAELAAGGRRGSRLAIASHAPRTLAASTYMTEAPPCRPLPAQRPALAGLAHEAQSPLARSFPAAARVLRAEPMSRRLTLGACCTFGHARARARGPAARRLIGRARAGAGSGC